MKETIQLLLFLLTIVSIQLSEARVSSGSVLLTGSQDLIRLTKFAISKHVHGSKFSLKLRIPENRGMYTDERNLKVYLFSEHKKDGWKSVKKLSTCPAQTKLAVSEYPVTFRLQSESTRDNRGGRQNKAKNKSFWEANVEFTIPTTAFTNYWYIALGDCSLEYNSISVKDAPQMDYSFTILNGNSHLSADEMGMRSLHVLQIIVSALLLLYVLFHILKSITNSNKTVHIVLIMVVFALLYDILSAVCELLHESIYAFNGIGSYSFDCLASHLEAQCDALIALVLVMVGYGWTLPSDVIMSHYQMRGSILVKISSVLQSPATSLDALKRGNPTILLMVGIFISNAILAQWGRTFDAEFDSFHDLEHTPGRVLMYFRMMLGIVFMVGVTSVKNGGTCPSNLKQFLDTFQWVGLVWFLSLPFVTWYCSKAMHPHQKHFALSLGAAVIQSVSLSCLVWLFTASKHASVYHRMTNVSSDNQSLSSYDEKVNVWKFGKTKVRLD